MCLGREGRRVGGWWGAAKGLVEIWRVVGSVHLN